MLDRPLRGVHAWFGPEPYKKFFYATICRIREALPGEGRKLRILLFSNRPEYFDPTDLLENNESQIDSVIFCRSEEELRDVKGQFDIAIVCQHLIFEHKICFIIRGKCLAKLLVVWTWDNHHYMAENLQYNTMADFVFPAHEYASAYLKTPHYILGKHIPLCTAQWARSLMRRLIMENEGGNRLNALSGGFIMWESERNSLLTEVKASSIPNVIGLIPEADRDRYFSKTAEERFLESILYKACLSLPLRNDLSLRIFDSLAAGQIPLVPRWCHDLDTVIPASVQRELPIVRFECPTVDSVRAAWEEAVHAFDSMGIEGVRKRHIFARENHHISVRLREIVQYISNFPSNQSLTVVCDEFGVGLVTDRAT